MVTNCETVVNRKYSEGIWSCNAKHTDYRKRDKHKAAVAGGDSGTSEAASKLLLPRIRKNITSRSRGAGDAVDVSSVHFEASLFRGMARSQSRLRHNT